MLALPATFACVGIHAMLLRFVIWRVHQDMYALRLITGPLQEFMLVCGVTLLALTAHVAEIAVWALAFNLFGEFSNFTAAFYHSALNYTTLGDNIVMSPRWRLLGPLEAAVGMLMFGVSTALIFAIVQRMIVARYGSFETESGSAPASKVN